MLLPDPDPFWLKRWDALSQVMGETIKRPDLEPEFRELLEALRDFGKKQFDYFFYGFSHGRDDGRAPRLVKDYEYPPDYVLRTIVDQVAQDFELIQRAMYQRAEGTAAEKKTLEQAEQWAKHLLAPLVQSRGYGSDVQLLDHMPTLLLYFNRSARTRLIPYAPAAFIGLLLTATQPGRRRDLLVIPHELGHYVYHQGQFKGERLECRLRDMVQADPPYLRQWIEEIFADVCGFMISREPALLPGAFGMIRDNAPGAYMRHNEIHPLDAVRFDIYVTTLKFIEGFGQFDLASLWETLDRQRTALDAVTGGFETAPLPNRHGKLVYVPLEKIRREVSNLVMRIADEIMKPAFRIRDWKGRGLAEKDSEEEAPSTLAPHSPVGGTLSPAKEVLEASGLLADYEDFLSSATFRDWYSAFDDRFDSLTAPETAVAAGEWAPRRNFLVIRDTEFAWPVQPAIWKTVFAGGGWTIKGPETQPTGGWEPDWRHSAFHF